jgi:hypothetical protein
VGCVQFVTTLAGFGLCSICYYIGGLWAVFSLLLHWLAVGCVKFVTTLAGCGLCSVCYYIGGLWAVFSLLLHWRAVGCVQFVTTLAGCGLCSVCYILAGCGLCSVCLAYEQEASFWEHGSGLSGSIKGAEFLGQLSNCWCLKDCPLVFCLSVSVFVRSVTHLRKTCLL